MADNTKHLEASWNKRSEDAKEKEVKAIGKLEAQGKSVNFNSVHQKSGVSKNYLYQNEELRTLIETKRTEEQNQLQVRRKKYDKTSKSKDVIIETKDKYIAKLEVENKQLKKELNQLRAMLYEKR